MTDHLLPWSGGDTWTRYVRSLNWAIPTLVVVVIGDATPVTVGETVYVALIIVSTPETSQAIFIDGDQLELHESRFLKRCKMFHDMEKRIEAQTSGQ